MFFKMNIKLTDFQISGHVNYDLMHFPNKNTINNYIALFLLAIFVKL